eukprot:422431_1
MRYHFNISADKILESESQCVWFEFNRNTELVCDGQCSNFTYFNHTVNIDIKIDFTQINTNTTNLCTNFFGDINSTEISVKNVQGITTDALGIYFRTGYDWERYVAADPIASFVPTNNDHYVHYLLCNKSIPSSEIAHLFVTFNIRHITNDPNQVRKNYVEGSEFYRRLHSLLTNVFGEANLIISTEVVIINNIMPRHWYEEILTNVTSTTYAVRQYEVCCCNKVLVFNPVDEVKWRYIADYYSRVIGNFAAAYFIYELLIVLVTKELNNLVLKMNVAICVLLSFVMFLSYLSNILYQCLIIVHKLPMNVSHDIWMRQNRRKIWAYLAVSGSLEKTYKFSSCKLLGLSSFSCPLTNSEYRNLYNIEKKCVLTRVVIELLLQMVSTVTIKVYSDGAFMSTFICKACLECKWQQTNNQRISFLIKDNNYTQNYHIGRNKVIYYGTDHNQEELDIFEENKSERIVDSLDSNITSLMSNSADVAQYGSNDDSMDKYWHNAEIQYRNSVKCSLCQMCINCICRKTQNDMIRYDRSVSDRNYSIDM